MEEAMSVDESSQATLDTVAEELNERAANMRVRSPHANKVSKEETALQLAIVLIGEMKERQQTIPYTTEYYAQRILHLVRWSGSNIGGGVMIEYLIDHGGDKLDLYFHRLLDQTEYQDGEVLPEEMCKAIQHMRKEGRDPAESYKPGDNKRREIWQCAVEQMRLMDELDPTRLA
jgi:cell division protein ZapA (FtsZ GTPase activity inhibitor)